MSTLENFVSPALTQALGWTLLHSLWQGALVAAALAGALLLLRRHRAQLRYLASASALGVLAVATGLTFARYYTAGNSSVPAPAGPVASGRALPLKPSPASVRSVNGAGVAVKSQENTSATVGVLAAAPAVPGWLANAQGYFDQHLPLLVLVWMLGLLAMSLRMLGGLLYVQRLRRYRVKPLGAAWQARLAALAERGGLRRPVALLESALVQVPLVVGHLRPVILLPLGTVAGLPPACLEAILAHELAHVLRRDYLVNLLQTVAEVLFFYHPAVWFMGSCLRAERENCCDDTATELCGGDPLRLARALTALAEWSHSAVVPGAPRLALAAVGGRGSLLGRVRRLVQRRPAAPTLAEGVVAACLMLGGLGLLGGSVVLAAPGLAPLAAKVKNQAAPAGLADTTKRVAPAAPPRSAPAPLSAPAPAPVRELSVSAEDEKQVEDAMDAVDAVEPREPLQLDEQEPTPPRGRPGARPGSSTVVIQKDKKGRVTDLVVNGQRIESVAGKSKGKAQSKAQDNDARVEVIQVPAAPGRRTWVGHDGEALRLDGLPLDRQRELLALGRLDELAPDFKFDFQTLGTGENFRFDFDADGYENLNPAAAARVRRGLESGLRSTKLSAEQRRAIEKSLAQLDSRPAAGRRLDEDRDEASREREEARRERAEELRERREELRERIRETQEELRELELSRAELQGDVEMPAPPRPPRAPRAPRAPLAARAPEAPRLPRSPRAPQAPSRASTPAPPTPPSTAKVRDALRADGLIGKNDKSFQFSLKGETMTVNGKPQPVETAAKYRKLLKVPSDGKTTYSMSISETD